MLTAHSLHTYKDVLAKIQKNYSEISFFEIDKFIEEATKIW